MLNISWLESIAEMADYEVNIASAIQNQSEEIQSAYKNNDQTSLTYLFGGVRLASKQEVFC